MSEPGRSARLSYSTERSGGNGDFGGEGRVAQRQRTCRMCDHPLGLERFGVRLYCSSRCRQAAYRVRKADSALARLKPVLSNRERAVRSVNGGESQ